MAHYEILLQFSSGKPAEGWKISNSYNGDSEITDDAGRVVFSTDSTGTISVYVDGKEIRAKPGTTVVGV